MTRRMSPTRRLAIYTAHQGRCHICGERIDGARERWEVEHIVPYALTRDDTDANLAPAHVSCHATKTPGDVAQIAKAKRVQAKHVGAWRPRSKLPGSRGTPFRRKINGTTERREP